MPFLLNMFIQRIKKEVISLLLLINGFFFCQSQEKPNIILFLVDDMGWQDTSVPFAKHKTPLNQQFKTPNMERLASQGMKFTNAYAAPVCSPSRVSLMTGLNAAHHKVTNWTLRKNQAVDEKDSILESPSWNVNGMSPVNHIEKTIYATPLPALLKNQNYYTIHVGKAHFGAMQTPAENPKNIGFDVNIAGHAAGGLASYLGENNYGNKKGEHTLPSGVPDLEKYHGSDVFLTEALTQEAIKAIEKPIELQQPFFLYMSHYAVHIPLDADHRFLQKYLAKGLSKQEAQYAALIEGMDKSLGDLMNYLEQKNVDKNTIIIFMSDNGGLSLSPPRGGKAFTHNLPLKSGKGSVYEGGIREPMIVKWPGVVEPATTTEQYVIIEDFFPSILEMAGAQNYKTIQAIDGVSFVPILKNVELKNDFRKLIWHFPNKWIPTDAPGINYKSAIRKGDWKLIYNMKSQKKELYNLNDDMGENYDLAQKFPKIVNHLSQLLGEQLEKWDSPMPFNKIKNKKVPYPHQVQNK